MGMSSHSSVSHCFSVSLSGARGDWESAEDLDQLLCITYITNGNTDCTCSIGRGHDLIVVNEIELHS